MARDKKGNLTLTRKPGESIEIGPDITVKVVNVRDNKVSLRITSPREVNICRTEIAGEYDDGFRGVAETQAAHWIVQIGSERWLGNEEDDGRRWVTDRRDAFKFASEKDAETALSIERQNLALLGAKINCIHG